MRRARFLACFLIAVAFPGPISSLFAQDVTSIIHDVSDVADGSIEQARLEAQRQATGAGPAYRSYKKGDSRFFSGKYTPPELPEDKKDRFVYGLAMFSDDGCDVTIKGSRIHQRLGKGQHLPSIGDSFHLLPIVLTPGEPVDITVGYSNTIYVNDPDSPDYPDIDGCTLFLYLIPAAIAVDANRDGTIAFSGEARDVTSRDAPFRFWCNDDDDRTNKDHPGSSTKDSTNNQIESIRDLEDFTRLHLYIGGLQDAIADGSITVGLEWRNATGSPSINAYQAAENNGGDQYLKTELGAGNQALGAAATTSSSVTNGGSFKFPPSFWKADALSGRPVLSAAHPNRYLIFEGADGGKGQLVLTFWKGNTPLGEGPSVWLDLKNIKEMYARVTATPETVIKQYESDSPNFDDSDFNFSAEAYTPFPDEEKKALVFVHGWNQSYNDSVNFAETMFKRLWHQGYKGRFCAFRWATLTNVITYNTSEYRAWKYGSSLAKYLDNLPGDYLKNVAAHSMGNVVVASALQRGTTLNRYFLMQAAIPGGCYSDIANNYLLFAIAEQTSPTPDTVDDLGYRLCLQEAYTRVAKAVNFFNQLDFALARGEYPIIGSTHWEQNQLLFKPNANLGIALANRTYAYDSGPQNNPYPIGHRCFLRDSYPPFSQRQVTDIHESMAYVARPRSRAIGADPNSANVISDSVNLEDYGFGEAQTDHSGQFNRRIQQVGEFYRKLFAEMQ